MRSLYGATDQERIAGRYIPTGYTEFRRNGDNVIYASADHKYAMAYRAKAGKHTWHLRFVNENDFNRTVTGFFESVERIKAANEKKKEEKSGFTTALKPGDILESSWGWEQTNVDFYQVIAVRGKRTIIMREIGSDLIESTGQMSGKRIPVKDAFIKDAPELRKRAGSLGPGNREYISLNSYSSAHLWDGKPCFCSWYG